jgi:heterotetrameric sarcosine oxidase beta subunit
MDDAARRGNAMRLFGVDARMVMPDELAKRLPGLDLSQNARFPILGGLEQPRAGTARHDAVAWGYARGADRRGVDILENCEVTGFLRDGDRITGVKTTRGEIRAKKVAVCVAGSTGQVMKMAGIDRLPIESHVLQAFVSESLKPMIDTVVTFGGGHLYISQSDKGGLVFGGDIDGYNTYAQRGNLPIVEDVMAEAVRCFPPRPRCGCCAPGAASWTCRWTARRSSPPARSPACISIAAGATAASRRRPPPAGASPTPSRKDEPHDLNAAYSLDRFHRGHVIDEKGQGSFPWRH